MYNHFANINVKDLCGSEKKDLFWTSYSRLLADASIMEDDKSVVRIYAAKLWCPVDAIPHTRVDITRLG